MRETDSATVRRLALFQSMDEAVFADLLRAAYLQTFPPQLQLISEGSPADFLYVVLDGHVELYASTRQRQTTMAIIEPVAAFILAAVMRDQVYLMSARTLTPARLLLIPSPNVHAAFEADPAFARAIVRELARAYRELIKAQKDLKLRNSVERLAARLLRMHEQQGAKGVVDLAWEKKTFAALLGMTPENLSRAFNTLKPYGIEVEGARIHVGRPEELRDFARPDPLIDDGEA